MVRIGDRAHCSSLDPDGTGAIPPQKAEAQMNTDHVLALIARLAETFPGGRPTFSMVTGANEAKDTVTLRRGDYRLVIAGECFHDHTTQEIAEVLIGAGYDDELRTHRRCELRCRPHWRFGAVTEALE